MAKIRTVKGHVSATQGRGKKTSQGRGNVGTSTMNKNKKVNLKKYRGQGK
jgi:ribosomal protein L15|tara:strand:+ start:1346 stop:1495 length:150 start_codon:yes stop_codon:yes gene_type:complete